MPVKSKGEKKFEKVMGEYGKGKLKSSSGDKVKIKNKLFP